MPKLTRPRPKGIKERLALAIIEDGRLPTIVARDADVDHSLVSRLLSGKKTDALSGNLVKLARELKVNINWLLTGEEPMKKPSSSPAPVSTLRASRPAR